MLKLVLQPIVENAIYHGVKWKRTGGDVVISGREEQDDVVLVVSDNGIGIPPARLEALRRMLENGHREADTEGFGIKNVDERIKIYFGNRYGIRIDSTEGVGTVVRIVVPKLLAGAENA
jgi:two-component system sensor histidine kinase YesM